MKTRAEVIKKRYEVDDKISKVLHQIKQQKIPHIKWQLEADLYELEIELKLIDWFLN